MLYRKPGTESLVFSHEKKDFNQLFSYISKTTLNSIPLEFFMKLKIEILKFGKVFDSFWADGPSD